MLVDDTRVAEAADDVSAEDASVAELVVSDDGVVAAVPDEAAVEKGVAEES